MSEQNVIRNDGRDVFFPETASGKKLFFQDGSFVDIYLGFMGTNVVRLTADYRVQVSGYTLSETQTPEFIVPVLKELGFAFEEDNPRSRVEHLRDEHGNLCRGWKDILEMAGHEVPRWPATEGFETTNGLVFKICNAQRHPEVAPVLSREVRREASILISAANRWLHENLRSFKRSVKLTPFQAVELYMRAKNSQVECVEVELGSTVETKYWEAPSFGSGGGWSTWTVYGEVTHQGDSKNSRSVLFDQGPAVIYSAAGDAINGGRNFHRVLYVVSPTGNLAEKVKGVL